MPGDVRITVTRSLSKDQQARRARLIDAARELALQGGYAAVTMHDVADRAGVARATVYRYFATKDHLLTEVAVTWAHVVTDGTAALAVGDTPAERLTGLLVRIVEVAAADRTLTSAVIQAVTSDDPSVEDARTALFLLVRDRLAAVIGEPVPDLADIEIVLGHVLLAALVSLTSLGRPLEEVRQMVTTAGRLIMAGVPARRDGPAVPR
ncbi:DNA-binding transcriptional regulator, AcrR family [Thermomonospora echinospora]|uniref:DNA-binding transcriptional regulator, AcrR family n=1 Tax=Thermomonospora echinospora TaxID=1992 RepID=A0A1H5W139_9ACTN|nr:TetR/AcrR family transcriptional regulator [Thermomonospora echinospora]SEF93239.1 DNA-binding transcriptional regulator, AcrR family [Thermomonospora echinospora]